MANVVKYIGLSDTRRVTKEAWEKAGVKGQDTVVWDKRNGYSIPLDQFNDAALERLSQDGSFVLPESGQKSTAKKSAES